MFFHVNVDADKEFIEKIVVFLIHTYIETHRNTHRERGKTMIETKKQFQV